MNILKQSSPSLLILIVSTLFCTGCQNNSKGFAFKSEFHFGEDDRHSFAISPFEADAIFLMSYQGSKMSPVECNVRSEKQFILEKKSWKRTFLTAPVIFIDEVDSILWVGGWNRDLWKYDHKSNESSSFAIKGLKKIHDTKDKTYLPSRQGLFYWDKKAEKMAEVQDLPKTDVSGCRFLDDHTIVIDGNCTYNLTTKTEQEGIHIYGEKLAAGAWFQAHKGYVLYRKDGQTMIATKAGTKPLGFGNGSDKIAIKPPYIWQVQALKGQVLKYNLKTDHSTNLTFLIPRAGRGRNNSLNYIYDEDKVWIQGLGQLHYVDSETGKNYLFPNEDGTKFKSLKIKNGKAYLMYADKLVVMDKAQLITECQEFDHKKFAQEVQEFRRYLASLEIRKEKSEQGVLKKLRIAYQKYGDHPNVEIQQILEQQNIAAFQHIEHTSSEGFARCYRDTLLPKERRHYCATRQFRQLAREGEFENILNIVEEMEAMELTLTYLDSHHISIVNQYFNVLDSLEGASLPKDSLDFEKAMALELVFQASWFWGEGCAPIDQSLLVSALNGFLKKHPKSKLSDNAALHLLDLKYPEIFYEDFDLFDDTDDAKQDYQALLRRYPQSDLRPKIELLILKLSSTAIH